MRVQVMCVLTQSAEECMLIHCMSCICTKISKSVVTLRSDKILHMICDLIK